MLYPINNIKKKKIKSNIICQINFIISAAYFFKLGFFKQILMKN